MNVFTDKLQGKLFSTSLQCDIVSIGYDDEMDTGELIMSVGDCCDMSACIALFTSIDPGVKVIETYSGAQRDTVYRLVDEEWKAYSTRGE